MNAGLSGLAGQLERHGVDSEIIVVDWNPPPDRPTLTDVIEWPARATRFCRLRVIKVPPAQHQRVEGWDRLPMNVVAAMNCGIRRANGRFVLPRPADLIYSEELVAFLAERSLDEQKRYRIDRLDVAAGVVTLETLAERLTYCESHIVKRNDQGSVEGPIRRWNGPALHTNASGDFQLMARSHWHRLRGYYEHDIAGAYVDGLLSYASHAAGIREVVLRDPLRLYHMDHGGKFNDRLSVHQPPMGELLRRLPLNGRLSRRIPALHRRLLGLMGYRATSSVHGVRTLDYVDYQRLCRQIIEGKRSFVLNGDGWGVGDAVLEETNA
jgi:hypothetical protein